MGTGARWAIRGALVVMLGSIGIAEQNRPITPMSLDDIVRSIEAAQAATHPQASYQVIREYRLFGARDSRADSEVVAEVDFRPPASKAYRIQRSEGSNRGPQLVRHILDHEVEATAGDHKASRAITRDNYNFTYIGEAVLDGAPCFVLGLKPKRTDKDLLSGNVWIDQHSFRVRQIEGDVEKTPSWWLKRLRIKLTFADVEGIWMQTGMEATADVRIVGTHTLRSRILDYRRQAEVAATPFPAISPIRKR